MTTNRFRSQCFFNLTQIGHISSDLIQYRFGITREIWGNNLLENRTHLTCIQDDLKYSLFQKIFSFRARKYLDSIQRRASWVTDNTAPTARIPALAQRRAVAPYVFTTDIFTIFFSLNLLSYFFCCPIQLAK